jgi:K+-transporting ATPase ATPase C chain
MQAFLTSLRLTVVTLLCCSGAYVVLILGVARLLSPTTAEGSLIAAADGQVVGSRLLAQGFQAQQYFWPRPSAVGYNAQGAGGSNKSPTSADLTARAQEIVAAHGATAANPLPAELAAASGGGLDPHLSERAALYQVERIAAARGLPAKEIESLVRERAFRPGAFLASFRVVNVLELNLALDALARSGR